MPKKDPLGYSNAPSSKQRTERTRTAMEMERMGMAGRMSNEGPEIPLTPRTLGERANVKKKRLEEPGFPKKGGGVVGPTFGGTMRYKKKKDMER